MVFKHDLGYTVNNYLEYIFMYNIFLITYVIRINNINLKNALIK